MAISLKKITEMVEAQSLQGDEHFFVQIGNAFQEVPLPIITQTILNSIGFPKGFADVSAAFAAREDSTQTALEYLWTLPAGSYILNDTSGDSLQTYQMTRLNGSSSSIARWLFTQGSSPKVELWTTAYDSGNTPLISIDASQNNVSWKGSTLVTSSDLATALNGVGIPTAKEDAASAEAGLNSYTVTATGLPTVVRASQTQDGRPVGKGKQIVFIPEHNNTGTDPTLTLNGGDSIPIRQRASVASNNNQNTVQITADTLIQGMPYTLTFCGVAWLIDSYLPGEGAETTATVTSVNNKTGAVKITADDLGAALAVANWKVVTKAFLRLIQNEQYEDLTPQAYLWTRKQGCYFIRYSDGIHVLVRVDLGENQTDAETGVTARTGPVIRLYANIPESDGESTISGGLWIGETQLAAITSLTDLTAISLLLNNSPLITESALLTRLAGYVSNAGLALTLGSYSTTAQVQALIAAIAPATSTVSDEDDKQTLCNPVCFNNSGKLVTHKDVKVFLYDDLTINDIQSLVTAHTGYTPIAYVEYIPPDTQYTRWLIPISQMFVGFMRIAVGAVFSDTVKVYDLANHTWSKKLITIKIEVIDVTTTPVTVTKSATVEDVELGGDVKLTSLTYTLAASDWTASAGKYYQTVTASALSDAGQNESILLQASATPSSSDLWSKYGVKLASATAGTLTFSSDELPATGEDVHVSVAVWR